jgi:hypothetical protein
MGLRLFAVQLLNGDLVDIRATSVADAMRRVNRDAAADGLDLGYRAVRGEAQ